ncbi:hypothetical protein MRB53_010445 [Persea americana]|uniref:Uncharacterized protein n=1 Tax=Persea americana TaxID=3435 RepID=A0ACC2LSM4_PERAE|nr:hypothetical protein MRB53_010445 [Persea americana]
MAVRTDCTNILRPASHNALPRRCNILLESLEWIVVAVMCLERLMPMDSPRFTRFRIWVAFKSDSSIDL